MINCRYDNYSIFRLKFYCMTFNPTTENQIQNVTNFQDLVATPFKGRTNTICWSRNLVGDFAEIVNKVGVSNDIIELIDEDLLDLQLSPQGQIALEVLLADMELLKAHGAAPSLNVITSYDRDDTFPFFPTDVYSFHVDRSPVPVDTYLCTYYGAPSEIIPNNQAKQKILIPEIRNELKKLHAGPDEEFEAFLADHFFDLHYLVDDHAKAIVLGLGHLCKIAIDHPKSEVLPCLHRAPIEKKGEKRLLLIC